MRLTKEQMTGDESVDNMILLACRLSRIQPNDLIGSCRVSKLVDVRCCVAKILRECFDLTQVETGKILCKDHATIHFYEKEHLVKIKYGYYSAIYNELKFFARNEGYEVDENNINKNADIENYKLEVFMLRAENKRLKSELKKVESIKKSLLSLSI
mgnify:CR=1 FL=1